MNTSKSDKVVERYRQRADKPIRKTQSFSGTWPTTVEELFPLFCPVREADWIPGWDCELIYTDSGYAEDKCVFKTDKANSVGDGVWVFTGYEKNKFVEFVRFQEDVLTHAKITVTDNHDGTVTATWNMVITALTERGNEEVRKMEAGDQRYEAPVKMIDHYLKKGETVKRSVLGMLFHH
jgi:hypothetical protein